MTFKPQLITGGRGEQGQFVCPFCAGTYGSRAELDAHWEADPRCKRNRFASNPLQSKYGMASGIENIPGEPTLTRVRSAGCDHEEALREPLRPDMDPSSPIIGYRCGYCYTEVYYTLVTEGSLGSMDD